MTKNEDSWKKFQEKHTAYVLIAIEKNKLGHLIRDHLILAEDALRQAYNFIKKYPDRQHSPKGLLYRIVERLINKASQRPKEVPLDDENQTPDLKPGALDTIINREDEQEKSMLKKILRVCIERLTEKQREVLDMWTKGMKWIEIAEDLEIGPAAVWHRKNGAFNSLRECIDELRGI